MICFHLKFIFYIIKFNLHISETVRCPYIGIPKKLQNINTSIVLFLYYIRF